MWHPFKWSEWRGSFDGRPTMYIKHLVHLFGYRIDIHKMVRGDDPYCFHSHPATAYRWVIKGGYTEEVVKDDLHCTFIETIKPGSFSKVTPDYIHRIDRLSDHKSSWSIWFRGRKTDKIKLIGKGWH